MWKFHEGLVCFTVSNNDSRFICIFTKHAKLMYYISFWTADIFLLALSISLFFKSSVNVDLVNSFIVTEKSSKCLIISNNSNVCYSGLSKKNSFISLNRCESIKAIEGEQAVVRTDSMGIDLFSLQVISRRSPCGLTGNRFIKYRI